MWTEKLCNGCGIVQARDDFPVKNSRTGQRHSDCRGCCRRRSQEHYQRNHAAYIERNRRNTPTQRQRNALFVYDYLSMHPCILCGESDPVVLEFNHRDASSKIDNMSDMVRSACSIQRLKQEIAKCDVVCANCHQRLTSQSRPVHYRREPKLTAGRSRKAFRVAADARNYAQVLERLKGATCMDCAADDPLVLQFDHIRDKEKHVSWLAGSGCSPQRLMRELDRCVIRCANCHRRATAQRGSWFRTRQSTAVDSAGRQAPVAASASALLG